MDRDQPSELERREPLPFSVYDYMAANDDRRQEFLRNYETTTPVPDPPSYEEYVVSQGAAAFPTPGTGEEGERFRPGHSIQSFIPLEPDSHNNVAPFSCSVSGPPPSYDDLYQTQTANGDHSSTGVADVDAAYNVEDETHNANNVSITLEPQLIDSEPQPTSQQRSPAPAPSTQRWLHQKIIDLKIPSTKFSVIVMAILSFCLTQIVVGVMSFRSCVHRIPSIMIAFGISLPLWIFCTIHCVKFRNLHHVDSKLSGLTYMLGFANFGITIAGCVFVYGTFENRTDPGSEFYCIDLPYFLAFGIFTFVLVVIGSPILYLILMLFFVCSGLKSCLAECKEELKTFPQPETPVTEEPCLCRGIMNLKVPSCKFLGIAVVVLVIPSTMIVVGVAHFHDCEIEVTIGMIMFGLILPITLFGGSYSLRFKNNHGKPCQWDRVMVILVLATLACVIYMAAMVFGSFDLHDDRTSAAYCADLPYFLSFSVLTVIFSVIGILILCALCRTCVLQRCSKNASN